MSLRIPPSLQKPYDDFFTGDPAFRQPPPTPADGDATGELLVKQHRDLVRIAHETGDWSALIIEGQQPTAFVMRAVPRAIVYRLRDAMTPPAAGVAPKLGPQVAVSLFFRAALRGARIFEDGQPYDIKLVDNEYGAGFASEDVLRLDDTYPGLVFELGTEALRRAIDIRPKS